MAPLIAFHPKKNEPLEPLNKTMFFLIPQMTFWWKFGNQAKFSGSPAIGIFWVEERVNQMQDQNVRNRNQKLHRSDTESLIFSKICMMAGAGGPRTAGGRLSFLLFFFCGSSNPLFVYISSLRTHILNVYPPEMNLTYHIDTKNGHILERSHLFQDPPFWVSICYFSRGVVVHFLVGA